MSFVTERDVIFGAFQDGFKNVDGSEFVPVQYDNKPRPDVDKSGAPITTWARFTVKNGQSVPKTIGGREKRNHGIVYLEIFIRENAGIRPARACADKLMEIFENKRFLIDDGDITFRQVQLNKVGDENGWSKHNALIEFQRDQFTPAPTIVKIG
jgi:hypothetical protein